MIEDEEKDQWEDERIVEDAIRMEAIKAGLKRGSKKEKHIKALRRHPPLTLGYFPDNLADLLINALK